MPSAGIEADPSIAAREGSDFEAGLICSSDGLDFRCTRTALNSPTCRADGSERAGFELLYLFENYALDTDRRELRRSRGLLSVEPQVFDLLVFLVGNRDRVLSKDDLLASVWGGRIVSESTIASRINAARHVIGDSGQQQRLIRTIISKGVRFVGTVREQRHVGEPVIPVVVPRLSIVVLPFTNLSNDPTQEYFVDGITDDLTTDLSRISGSFVIARHTAFTYKGASVDVTKIGQALGVRYVLEGSVRRADDRVRVNAQLIDAETGAHLWADRFDTDRANLAAAQDEITGRLARTLDVELVRDVGRRIAEEKAADPDAGDLVMRGRALRFRPASAANREQALRDFERAIEFDPGSSDAKIGIASTLIANLADGWSSLPRDDEVRAEQLLLEVLETGLNSASAHAAVGMLRRVQNRFSEAKMEFEAAITLDRNDAGAFFQLGVTVMLLGQPEAAIPRIEKAIRLNPHDANAAARYWALGLCHLLLRDVDRALELMIKARAENPRLWYVHLDLAGALGLRNDLEEARTALAKAIDLKPEMNSLARLRAHPGGGNPEFWALCENTVNLGLRRAGMPEE
jgi:adenylate cyclase